MTGTERASVILTVRVATPSVAASHRFWTGLGARTLLSRKEARLDVPIGPGLTLEAGEGGPAVPTLVGRGCDERFAAALATLPGGRKRGPVWVWETEAVAAIASLARGRSVAHWRTVSGPDRRARVVVCGEPASSVGAALPGLGFYRPDRAVGLYRREGVEVELRDESGPCLTLEVVGSAGGSGGPGGTMIAPSGVAVRRAPAGG